MARRQPRLSRTLRRRMSARHRHYAKAVRQQIQAIKAARSVHWVLNARLDWLIRETD